MRNFNKFTSNLKQTYARLRSNQKVMQFAKSPLTIVVGINTVLYVAWKLRGVSQQFLVKNFAFQRFNLQHNRYHTMLTYAFSHFGIFSYLIDSFMAVSFGRGIIASHGNKTFWMLYLGGAIAGAISMTVFKPHNSIIIPEVGAGPALSSLITFYALNNMHSYVYFFAFPIKMWVLFAGMGVFSITDPSKKDFGGILMGLFMFLLFKTRM